MNATERDETVLTMLEESRGMICNIAYKYNLDVEDCSQNAALAMLEAWDKIPKTCTNIKAYLHRCIRNKVLKFHESVLKELADSLDEPIPSRRDGREITLADSLAAPQTEDTSRVDSIVATVHNALRECMLEEQEYAVSAFEMYGFTPVAPIHSDRMDIHLKRAAAGKARVPRSLRFSVYNLLGRNPQVRALLPA